MAGAASVDISHQEQVRRKLLSRMAWERRRREISRRSSCTRMETSCGRGRIISPLTAEKISKGTAVAKNKQQVGQWDVSTLAR